jgi:hypothetical protein
VNQKTSAFKLAAVASLAVHLALGWWVLRSNPPRQGGGVQPLVSTPRLLVQLIALPPDKTPATGAVSEPNLQRSVNVRQAGQGRQAQSAPAVSSLEITPPLQAQGQEPASASQSVSEAPAMPPAAAAQPPAVLNLDLSRAAKTAESQRRKSGLATAIDAIQIENSQTPEKRAFAKLAPTPSSIVSETIMVDGSRLVKFSAGGCMRMVNPSSRSLDDVRKPVMETC